MAGNVITSAEALGGIPTGDYYDDGTDLWIMTGKGLQRLTDVGSSTFSSPTLTSPTATNLSIGDSANGINMAGTYTGHCLYIHPATALATAKRALRIGDYGTEFPLVAGEGVIRTYAKVTSGTDITALQFHWGFAESAAPLIGSQMQIESACATPGMTGLTVHDFIGGIQAGKFIAAGGDGFVGIRSKLYADVTSTCSGDCYPLWLDHQMSCAVAGTEASIKVTTGGSKPDAFVWFNTTSSGISNLFYFDSTMAAQDPIVTSFTGNSAFVPNNKGTFTQAGQLKILINTTEYYIPFGTVA